MPSMCSKKFQGDHCLYFLKRVENLEPQSSILMVLLQDKVDDLPTFNMDSEILHVIKWDGMRQP